MSEKVRIEPATEADLDELSDLLGDVYVDLNQFAKVEVVPNPRGRGEVARLYGDHPKPYDFDFVFRLPVSGVRSIRFTSLRDEGKKTEYGDVAIGEFLVE